MDCIACHQAGVSNVVATLGTALTEDHVKFLKRFAEGLLEDGKGVIILKENTCGEETFVVDSEDASVCRSLPYWLKLVEAAGLRVILQHMQDDFPDDIFPVPMLALEAAL